MKWWFSEKTDIQTGLPADEVMNRVKKIARNKHKILDTLNPDHVFDDDFKSYVGEIGQRDFKVKRKYVYATSRGSSQSMSIIVKGQVEDSFQNSLLHLEFSVPRINLLWFLFPPLWMFIGMAYAGDIGVFHGIPVFTVIALLLIFYLYWLVLAQFRRKAVDAVADFNQVLTSPNAFFY